MEKIRIVQSGLGKMGTVIFSEIKKQPDMEIIGVIDPSIKGEYQGVKIYTNVLKADILVDFSSPEGAVKNVTAAIKQGMNIICGTTKITQDDIEKMKKEALDNKVKYCFCPNFSTEVNYWFNDIEKVANTMKGKDGYIFEIHHTGKADMPSGTALKAAEILAKSLGKKGYRVIPLRKAFTLDGNEIEFTDKRKEDFIDVSCVRFAGEQGEHIAVIGDEENFIELRVKTNRKSYANGVIKTIRFLSRAKPGLYDFTKDILSI